MDEERPIKAWNNCKIYHKLINKIRFYDFSQITVLLVTRKGKCVQQSLKISCRVSL